MNPSLKQISQYKFLVYSLLVVGLANIISNLISSELAVYQGNFTYFIVAGILVFLSLIISIQFKNSGKWGKAWIMFFIFSLSFFIAEITWTIYELVFEIEPFPSPADFFYLLGYPMLFSFMFFYLKPVEQGISKKILITAMLISTFILIPTLFITIEAEIQSSPPILNLVLAASYPIADSMILVPALIGVSLFFKGKVNFLWTLICLGIISMSIADIGFLVTTLNESYYTGHPIEILFHWSYILFSFGVLNHIQIFKKQKDTLSKFDDINDLK